MTYIVIGALTFYGMMLALFVWSLFAVTPCTCPVGFADFMAGVRCARHPGYETEIRR